MAKLTQKEAVYQAVMSVVGSHGDGPCTPTREQRAVINQILFEGFRSAAIELDTEFTDSELKTYVSGLQSNWLRKDKRLNGGIAYVPKNPGSRTGSGDAQLKALKALMSTLTEPADKAEVQAHIDARTRELAKASEPTIDFSKLPPELAAKFKRS